MSCQQKKMMRQLLTANFEPLHQMVERQNCPVERVPNHHLKQGFLFGLAATHKQLESPTASASLSVLAAPASSPHVVAVYLTLSDSTDRWTDRGHSVRPSARRPPPRRGRWRPTFPSFLPSLPPLSNVCESRTDRPRAAAAGGRTTRLYPRASGLQFHRAISPARSVARSLSHPFSPFSFPLVARQPGFRA